jgi:predicted phosphodiesterase
MRYAIFSDVHANLEALEAVIESYKKESIDRYLCVGDVVGYAANPKECIERIKALCMITVAGNHDWGSVNLFSLDYFNPYAKEAILWTQENIDDTDRHFLQSLKLVYKNDDLTLVHGTLESAAKFNYLTDGIVAEESFKALENNVCFLGHTHVAGTFIKGQDGEIKYRQDISMKIEAGNKYIINVGSVGQPRDGNPNAAYCIYDTYKKEVCLKRVGYNIADTRKKIIAAGLPRFLAERLALGR